MKTINYYWRLFATAFCFFVFGVGGILIALIVAPIIIISFRNQNTRHIKGKLFIHYSFRMFIELMRLAGVLSYTVEGIEKFKEPGQLFLANHPSLIDVVFMIAFIPRTDCVVKGKLSKNPFTYGPVNAAGYIMNAEPEAVLQSSIESISSGNSLIIFPEGTRTTPGEGMKFKRGAANVALRGEFDITPVVIGCTPTTLTKSDKWYHIPPKKLHFTMKVKDKISIESFLQEKNANIAARSLTKSLEEYFSQEIKNLCLN
ncbi:MAG: 1-acyl-sn-glycerol-3-phosphate acyltransferase [Gammaproteobacteria bacterium]|nr:MAG: 1-acyl-sn-glycerol-3-phosphate acyltransferase [Gammaproteobacteria bacterium]